MTDQPNTPTKRDGHLTVYLVWPALAGVVLAVILATSIGGVTLLATRFDWDKAGMAAGIAFFVILGIGTLGVFLYVVREWAGPRSSERVETIRQAVEYIEPEPIEVEPRFIRLGGRAKPINTPAPMLPSSTRSANRAGIRAAMDHLIDKLTVSSTVTEYSAETETLEPDAPTWVKEFYDTIVTVWPTRSLSRRTFEALWPGGEGKRRWQKYVNGSGNMHSQKGIWDTWGIISQTGPRSTWEWCYGLEIIFSLDPDLRQYAEARTDLVQHSPSGPVGPDKHTLSPGRTGPDQTTSPAGQTKGYNDG